MLFAVKREVKSHLLHFDKRSVSCKLLFLGTIMR